MSRGNKWIPLDKYLAQYFVKIKRPFSEIEAMYSYTLDIDNNKSGSISGYSTQWQWSRNKVRRFLKGIRTVEGHLMDSKKTQKGHAIHFIDNALMTKKDSKRTVKGQQKDSKRYTTTKPNPKPKPKPKKKVPKKKPFIPPTKIQVQDYFFENGFTRESGLTAWQYYDAGNWKDAKGNQVISWKQKVRGVWFQDKNKIKQNNIKPIWHKQTRSERNAQELADFVNEGVQNGQ